MPLINRAKIRGVHTQMREVFDRDPKTGAFALRGSVRQLDGFLLEGQLGETAQNTAFTLQQDLGVELGGQGRAPSALAYMLMGVGF